MINMSIYRLSVALCNDSLLYDHILVLQDCCSTMPTTYQTAAQCCSSGLIGWTGCGLARVFPSSKRLVLAAIAWQAKNHLTAKWFLPHSTEQAMATGSRVMPPPTTLAPLIKNNSKNAKIIY